MKVLLLDCINNNLNLETNKAVESLIKGIESAGGDVNHIKLNNLDIKPCFSCTTQYSFEYGTECRCNDDMNDLYPELRKADIWIFAAHINTNGASDYLKNLLDRLEPLFQPVYMFESGATSTLPADNKMNGKIMLISSFEQEAAATARKISEYIDSIAMLFSKETAGNILFDNDRIDDSRLNMIFELGKNLITNGK